MYSAQQSQFSYWETGAWKHKPPRTYGEYMKSASWGSGAMWGATVGGFALGAKIGGALGTVLGPAGTVAGALAGAAIGAGIGLAAVGAYNTAAYGWQQLFGSAVDPRALEFTMPVVNTRLAATMRQSAMQSMMSSSQSYRSILGREASRLHR